MENIFGIPISAIMQVLLVAFALCLAVGAFILIRNRVIFRMGVRNIPRRPAQTVLIVIGLMLSTLIIAAALTTGDTLNYSIRSDVYTYLGEADELIVRGGDDSGQSNMIPGASSVPAGTTVPMSLVEELRAETGDADAIEGYMAVVAEQVPAIAQETGLSEPAASLTGLEPAGLDAFGGLEDRDGNQIDFGSLADGEAVVSESLAEALGVSAGDSFTVFVQNQEHEISVAAVADDSYLTGVQGSGMSGGLAVPISYAQELLGYTDQASMIAVSNAGGAESSVDQTESAVDVIEPVLSGSEYDVVPVKESQLEQAELAGNLFSTLFVVLGMFSIAAGVLLIFLIFVLLAAERKPEMGMARAVGLKRRQLIQMYLAEGLAYDLVAAAVGALLGVGVAFIIAQVMGSLLGDFISIEPSASWQSLVIAYTIGVFVTFITILISSWRVSRLNIVAAIRDIPDEAKQREGRKFLIGGILGLIVGGLMLWGGAASGTLALYTMGMSLIPLCLAAILRRFGVPPRPLYSVASLLVLAYWVLPWEWTSWLEPEGMGTGGMEMFFISGIMMVAAATVFIVWNATVLTNLVGFFGLTFSRWLPAVKTAVAYPLASKGRTGMTIAMFSLIIFSLVAMATINSNFEDLFTGEAASAGWDIQATQGAVNPIQDFQATLAENGVDTDQIEASARVPTVDFSQAQVRMAGEEEWGGYTIRGVDQEFITESEMPLQIRAEGYDSDEEVWQAIAENPNLAVVDAFAVPQEGSFSVGGPSFRLEGVSISDETMDPVPVEIGSTANGGAEEITIIGVVDQQVTIVNGLFLNQDTFDSIFAQPTSYVYFMRAAEGVDHAELAADVESALIQFGVQAQSIEDIIDEQLAINRGFIYLVEGFMALGLVVGIAALGVVSFRSVVERRQQIGMLRAIGYDRKMISVSFLIESTMITVLGVVSGTALALWLAYQLMTSEELAETGSIAFTIPWGTVLIFAGISMVASLLMAYIPARQASRVAIADALRYE